MRVCVCLCVSGREVSDVVSRDQSGAEPDLAEASPLADTGVLRAHRGGVSDAASVPPPPGQSGSDSGHEMFDRTARGRWENADDSRDLNRRSSFCYNPLTVRPDVSCRVVNPIRARCYCKRYTMALLGSSHGKLQCIETLCLGRYGLVVCIMRYSVLRSLKHNLNCTYCVSVNLAVHGIKRHRAFRDSDIYL